MGYLCPSCRNSCGSNQGDESIQRTNVTLWMEKSDSNRTPTFHTLSILKGKEKGEVKLH